MDEALRKQVRERAGNRCEYCRVHQEADPFYTFPVDHIIAQQHRGKTSLDNLCISISFPSSGLGTQRLEAPASRRTDGWLSLKEPWLSSGFLDGFSSGEAAGFVLERMSQLFSRHLWFLWFSCAVEFAWVTVLCTGSIAGVLFA